MVDFLQELPNTFRERYLQTHSRYLKSIADIIANNYDWRDEEKATVNMVSQLVSQNPRFREERRDPGHETPEFRNLRNCWYNECALNYPS